MICQMDLLASFSNYFREKENLKTDSKNYWNVFLGKTNIGRNELVLESSGRLAFRYKNYAFIPPNKGPAVLEHVKNETTFAEMDQLYNLVKDPGQKNNIAFKNAALLKTIMAKFEIAKKM